MSNEAWQSELTAIHKFNGLASGAGLTRYVELENFLGLQQISFGSATIFRPLMWFDRLDARDPLQFTKGVYGVLARYVAHFDPSFTGLTGSQDAIDALVRDLGVAVMIGAPAADGSYTVDHSAAVFVIDPDAAYAALFGAPHDAGTIARDFRRIVAARAR